MERGELYKSSLEDREEEKELRKKKLFARSTLSGVFLWNKVNEGSP